MFIIGAIFTYIVTCLISGIFQVRSFKAKYPAIYRTDIARKIMLNPPQGKGILQEYVIRTTGQDRLMPTQWYTLRSRSDFNAWALAITGIVMFFWTDMITLAMDQAQTAGEFYAGMLLDIFNFFGVIILLFFKAMLLGLAYLIMVANPRTQALNIEKNYWKDR